MLMLKKSYKVLADNKKHLYAIPYLTAPSMRYEMLHFNNDV